MKKAFSFIAPICFCALLLAFSDTVKGSAYEALRLWASQLVPVLFPFFICANLLRRLYGGKPSLTLMFLISMIAGAPAGARLCSGLPLEAKARTDTVSALNMISPMFIFGAYCVGMLKNAYIALPILLAQYISALFMFIISKPSLSADMSAEKDTREKGLFVMLSSEIYDAVCAMLSIGGTIVFFSVMLSVLGALFSSFGVSIPYPLVSAVCTGFFEFVNGCRLLSVCDAPAGLIAAFSAFIFSFGGLCVMSQSMSLCELLPGRYILRKLAQGAIAAVLAYLLSIILYNGEREVFLSIDAPLIKSNFISALGMFCASSLSLSFLWIIQFALIKKKAARKRAAR